jgi:3'-phosphoadenosine 5'-phosphosulfate sulfotransferase (PAPS reductase)/FAD synthetase
MTENEFILQDRLGVIRDTINKYGEENFYLSFSGGKDSTVLHHLIDLALPNNKIPRVFANTGIEYIYIYMFVKELADKDSRFTIIRPSQNIRQTLEKYG